LRILIVLRHGKSDWATSVGSDHDRPLKKRGRLSAGCVGRFLTATNQAPDLVLTSSALRAQATAELALEAGDWDVPLRVLPELYNTTPPAVLGVLADLPADVETVLLVNHEPTCSSLVGVLTGGPGPGFPTAAMARVDCEADGWKDVRAGSGGLVWLVLPRDLEAFDV